MNKTTRNVWKVTLNGKNVICKCEDCNKEWKGIYDDVIEKVWELVRVPS